jgi:general stress protein 26
VAARAEDECRAACNASDNEESGRVGLADVGNLGSHLALLGIVGGVVNAEQKQKLLNLFGQEQVAVLITQGEQWPTGTMQAFAETPDLDLLFIMRFSAEKFENLTRRPKVTVLVDTRDIGTVASFEIARASVQGDAVEVPRDTTEWHAMKAAFLKKNPFEAPFFDNSAIRMVRIKPRRISYANGIKDTFWIEL